MTRATATTDTIVAIATAPQNGAVGILRVSGPQALAVFQRLFRTLGGQPLRRVLPRYMHFGHLVTDEDFLDEAMAVYMPGPKSFTGEDVVEFHCHGNVLLLRRVLAFILGLSASGLSLRAAEPGEFTKRAYLNGRLDLTRAEAVHEIITAESEAGLKASLANLDGALAGHVLALKEEIKVALALVEASFEFPEEDIQTYDPVAVQALVQRSVEHLQSLIAAFRTSKLYDHGVSVALVGRPNVGKSSLLNAILVEERAIVTAVAGTTRDVVEGAKIFAGVRVVFRDTAGLRETTDVVESAGIERSQAWMRKSDLIFWITDDPQEVLPENLLDLTAHKPVLRILNKVDVLTVSPATEQKFDITLSARTGQGLAQLEKHLLDHIASQAPAQVRYHVNARQAQRIQEAAQTLVHTLSTLTQPGAEEVLAEDLRACIRALEEVTGEISNEDVLGEIFQRFCIGK